VLIDGRIIHIPFPTYRLAKTALRTLSVDEELSPLVRRSFSLVSASREPASTVNKDPFKAPLLVNAAPTQPVHASSAPDTAPVGADDEDRTVLQIDYRATTNRMLRVAVNGFFDSLAVVIQVMEELDVDVLHEKGLEGLEGVQGVEQGMTGTTVTGA